MMAVDAMKKRDTNKNTDTARAVRISDKMWQELTQRAASVNSDASTLIRVAIQQFLSKHEESKPEKVLLDIFQTEKAAE